MTRPIESADEPPVPGEDPALPRGYRAVRTLARRPGMLVLEALRGSERVALRLDTAADAEESRAELMVLGAVEHPGLARLVDHGALAGGGTFVAREWVEGVPLGEFAGERTPEELGRIAARICPALEHMHEHGFVHADLKPANVLVRKGDDPVLTDYGLARALGTAPAKPGVGGSFFAIAPEVLLGRAPDERADIFALGVLLAQLLVPVRVVAREFYARFPGVPFFEAAEIDPGDLPDWARDIVAGLVERDPTRRFSSAGLVGRTLEGRLGGGRTARRTESAPRLRWPMLAGRGTFVGDRLAAMRARASSREWWAVAPGDDAEAIADAVALEAALAGMPIGRVRFDRELQEVATSSALDRWAVDAANSARGGWLCVSGVSADRWGRRALDVLVRTLGQEHGASDATRSRGLFVVATADLTEDSGTFELHELPGPNEDAIHEALRRAFASEDEPRLEALAARLHAESRGTARGLQALIDDVMSSGWVQVRGAGLRLRPGALPDWLGRTRGRTRERAGRELSDAAAMVLAAVAVTGGRARLRDVALRAGLDGAELGIAVRDLVQSGRAKLDVDGQGRRTLAAEGAFTHADLELPEETWRALHRGVARSMEAAGEALSAWLPHLYRADPGPELVKRIADHARELRDNGCSELALDMLAGLRASARAEGRELEPLLAGQLAVTWAVAGATDRAMELLPALESADVPELRSLAAQVRGLVARLQGRHEDALRHFEEALATGVDDGGDTLVAQARLLFENGRDDELEALFATVSREPALTRPERVGINLKNLVAMSAFRRGDVGRAHGMLTELIPVTRQLGDPSGEASVQINLGTIARRTGRLDEAADHFERARALCEDAGYLAGVVQASALLGGTERERGRLSRAGELLAVALETAERLGDEASADSTRGILGLLYCERGWLRPALEELGRSAESIRARRWDANAALLEARAGEMRARLGETPGDDQLADSEFAESDPRILIALARTAWLCGRASDAKALANRARSVARKLARPGPAEEAEFLLARLAGRRPGAAESAQAPILEDESIVALLASDPFEEAAAYELACALADRGRDDRAARLFLALAARSEDAGRKHTARRRAEEALERCAIGLTSDEVGHMRRTLLGLPDPRPEDLEQADEYAQTEWDMEVLSILEINQRLVDQQDLPTLLGAIVESALEVTGAERGFLVLEEDGELSLDLAMDSRRGDIDEPEVEISQTIVRRALEQSGPLRLSNAADDPIFGEVPSVTQLELRSILCHPFDVQPGVRGVVYLDNRLRSGAFTASAERLLSLLASQAALAIRQVRRYEEIGRLNAELNEQVVTKDSDLEMARRALVEAGVTVPVDGLVGDAPAMRRVQELLRRVAPSNLSVLVCGASGTGKELAARALHDLSPRKQGPFVAENCAALPASLIESELFGYSKGAFTGAERDQPGLFERAHGGTLFLDEIAELPLELQAKLLRVLEQRVVRRVGDSDEREVDFRLVAATNRDLAKEVDEGRMRSDLYYRLDAVRIEMPTLAERVTDIPVLVDHFLRLEAAKTGVARACSPEILQLLCEREWPGNVRELGNEVARLCVLSTGDVTDPDLVRTARVRIETGAPQAIVTMAELERRAILDTLERTGGDKRRAAELLGISRAKIYQRLKEWGHEA